MTIFFESSRSQFFRPLNSKYREVVAQCLAQLYRRQFTSLADYGQSLSRQQILDAFTDVIVRSGFVYEDEGELLASDPRKLATWVFNQLKETGWIEERADAITMTSAFGLSPVGRKFAHALVDDSSTQVRTHHRNTRNTRNALKSFSTAFDIHDLLDAVEYSERIVADFSDLIVELEERRNQLIEEVKIKQDASEAIDHFFDFMERRFEPDLAVRLSADSVERYRDEILGLVNDIRKAPKAKRLELERRLRALHLQGFSDNDIWYEQLLRMIEQRLRNACEIMLPAVRDALSNFTQRADAIIRQLSTVSHASKASAADVVSQLGQLSADERAERVQRVGAQMQLHRISLVDPSVVKPIERRRVERLVREVNERVELSEETQRGLNVASVLENAFSIGDKRFRGGLASLLDGKSSGDSEAFQISSVDEFLTTAQLVSAGSKSDSAGEEFVLEYLGEQVSDDFFERRDRFSIKRKVVGE